MQAVGSNIEAARLSGIRVDRIKMFAFATAGLCAAITGTLLSSLLGSGTLGVGDGYLLDAFAAVFLGSATLRDGEFHIVGTFIGVLILAVGFNGLAILGAPTHFQPIFTPLACRRWQGAMRLRAEFLMLAARPMDAKLAELAPDRRVTVLVSTKRPKPTRAFRRAWQRLDNAILKPAVGRFGPPSCRSRGATAIGNVTGNADSSRQLLARAVTHVGQPERKYRHVCDDCEHNEQKDEEWQDATEHLARRSLA
jgi:hypothetical protein